MRTAAMFLLLLVAFVATSSAQFIPPTPAPTAYPTSPGGGEGKFALLHSPVVAPAPSLLSPGTFGTCAEPEGLSGGTVFLIITLVTSCVYVFGGIMLNR